MSALVAELQHRVCQKPFGGCSKCWFHLVPILVTQFESLWQLLLLGLCRTEASVARVTAVCSCFEASIKLRQLWAVWHLLQIVLLCLTGSSVASVTSRSSAPAKSVRRLQSPFSALFIAAVAWASAWRTVASRLLIESKSVWAVKIVCATLQAWFLLHQTLEPGKELLYSTYWPSHWDLSIIMKLFLDLSAVPKLERISV